MRDDNKWGQDDRRVVIRSFGPSVAVWCDCGITITSPDLIALVFLRFFFFGPLKMPVVISLCCRVQVNAAQLRENLQALSRAE